jgi:hypothetical protein
VISVAFSPDGKQVVSGSGDKTLILWDVATGQQIGKPWQGHQASVESVAFRPDKKFIVSVDAAGQIFRWPIPPDGWIELVCRNVGRGFTRLEWQRFIGETRPYETTCQEQWSLPSNRRAIMIGIDKMKDPIYNLAGCVNDALLMQEILQTFGKIFPQNIRLIKDEEATLANLTEMLYNWLPTQVGTEDTVIIYYAGQGSQVRDRNGDELEDQMDEILAPYDLNWDDPLTDDLLHEWLKNLQTEIVLILDAPNSGGFADDFAELDHVTVLAGSQSNQKVYEKDFYGTEHGAFTYFLTQGLQGEADLNHDRRVTVSEAFEYTKQQLKAKGVEQIPVLKPGRTDVVLTWLDVEPSPSATATPTAEPSAVTPQPIEAIPTVTPVSANETPEIAVTPQPVESVK